MNKSISNCNARLNLALSLSLWLMSNDLIILKNLVKGYNNHIKTASPNMVFGVSQINYEETIHPKTLSHHLETLNNK